MISFKLKSGNTNVLEKEFGAIKKVTSDIEEMKFNTSVAEFMKMTNEFYKDKMINKTINETLWPNYDDTKTIDDEIEIPVQINGKVKSCCYSF